MDTAAILLRKARTASGCILWRIQQEGRVAANRIRLTSAKLNILGSRLKSDFVILEWYARLGNNFQQLIVAIAHAERFKGRIKVSDAFIKSGAMADLLTPFELDFDPGRTCDHQFKARFFYYTEFSFSRHAFKRLTYRKGNAPRLDSLLGKKYIEGNTYRITQRYLTPRLIKTSSPWSHLCVDEQLIIIHLRAGDIASLDHHAYLTNPLCYYKFLSNRYRRCLVVSEPGAVHPLRDEILELFDWSESISGTVHEDFSILLDAKRLASSGVGTFSVAAALLSQCLQVFYCSNIYQDEHLNPKMLPPNRVQMLQLPGFVEAWRNSNDRHSLLRSFGTGSQ